jgi:uncharacterized protein YndB with AHSA1/START domain
MTTPITVSAFVSTSPAQAWNTWNAPEHIVQWAFASPDWHAPAATNDLQVSGQFSTTMAARDGSASFDFAGTYTEVVPHESIAYTMADGRKVDITFTPENSGTRIIQTFDPEVINTPELQRQGWQAILNNFVTYASLSAAA